jgi:non-specific serine/threonine protein kinase
MPFDREPTAAIDATDLLDLLARLVEKSLVLYEEDAEGRGRYRLLETVWEYAREKLAESGAGTTTRSRHRDLFVALAEEAEPQLAGAEQAEWLARLDAEHDNLRAALDWAVRKGEDDPKDAALRLCGALWGYWDIRGYWIEGRQWCATALAGEGQEAPTIARGKALDAAGGLAYRQGDYSTARSCYEQSLAIYREAGDPWGIADALVNLGNIAYREAEYDAARLCYEEGLTIHRTIGDDRGVAASLRRLGIVANAQGEYAAARRLYEESLTILREIGDERGIADSLNNLALAIYAQGDYPLARQRCEESLAIEREIGYRRGIALSLSNLASMAYDHDDYEAARAGGVESLEIQRDLGDRLGVTYSLERLAMLAARADPARGARLWGAAERMREEIRAPLAPQDRARYDREVAAARRALGEDAFARAWEAGREMTPEEAVGLALEM